MPWRGPVSEEDFPSLGGEVAVWIEENVVIPDGYRRGGQYVLTNEMLRFLKRFYRIDPEEGRLHFYGGQLRRSQKWGKRPVRRGDHPRRGAGAGAVRRVGRGG